MQSDDKVKSQPRPHQTGFTIVELLIVIVVIGILATISIVAYSGIQQRAIAASLTSDLDNASKLLKLDQVSNSAYPATLALANGGNGIPASSGTTYQYATNNTTNPQTFCITATKNTQNYKITDDGAASAGDCLNYGLALYLDAANPASYPGAGTTWTDLSGKGNNGTLTNGVVYSGSNGGTFSFDGIDDYVVVNDNNNLDLNNNFTVSAWVKLGVQNYYGILHKGDTAVNGAGLAYGYNTNGFMFISWNGSNTPYQARFGTDISQWHYLVGVVNANVRYLYVDGVFASSSGAGVSSWNNTKNLIIGAGGGLTNFMNGSISKISVYNRLLSDVEIQQDFNSIRSRYGI